MHAPSAAPTTVPSVDHHHRSATGNNLASDITDNNRRGDNLGAYNNSASINTIRRADNNSSTDNAYTYIDSRADIEPNGVTKANGVHRRWPLEHGMMNTYEKKKMRVRLRLGWAGQCPC